jgi:hypothetical protein
MLELQRYLFRKKGDFRQTGYVYEIFDPDTQERIGIVREGPPIIEGLLRRLFALLFTPCRYEVRETEDESLVFTVTRSFSPFGQEETVADADENVVGYVRSGLWIYDRDRVAIARFSRSRQKKEISILTPDGSELGMLTTEYSGTHSASDGRSILVSLGERLADEPFAKMLLLGAILGLDLF